MTIAKQFFRGGPTLSEVTPELYEADCTETTSSMCLISVQNLLNINELDPIRRYLPAAERPRPSSRYSSFQVCSWTLLCSASVVLMCFCSTLVVLYLLQISSAASCTQLYLLIADCIAWCTDSQTVWQLSRLWQSYNSWLIHRTFVTDLRPLLS